MLPRFELRHASGFPGYRGGGGSSSSSSSQSTTTTNVDKRQVVDNGAVGVSSDSSTVNVTTTDMGSIKAALQYAAENNQGLATAFDHLLAATIQLEGMTTGTLKANNDLATQLAGTASDQAKAASTSLTQNQALIIAAGAALAWVAFRRK